jgi:DNA ligase (NAD+)
MSKNEIKDLEFVISTLDTLYETGEECINPLTQEVVLDNEYDALKRQLHKICPSSKIFDTVTASAVKSNTKKVIHNPPMTSINKCNGTKDEKREILLKWMGDCQKNYPGSSPEKFFCMSYKHDGLALSIEYQNGKIVSAGLRSKSGKDGTNVTDKTPYIKGIPQTLPIPISCIIRGEIETPISVFKSISTTLGEDAKSNPRAHAAGTMNLRDISEVQSRGLVFTAYSVIMGGDHHTPYSSEIEREVWAKESLGIEFVSHVPFSFEKLAQMEKSYRDVENDYMIDGVVISVNNLEYQKELGTTGDKDDGNPRGKIAFKFEDEVKRTTVLEVQWQTGRTGTVTPVLYIDPVALEGTVVSRCTAHNVGIIKNNKIGIGSVVEVIKSGKIIPKLHKVIGSFGKTNIPSICPSCSGPLVEKDGADDTVSLHCYNQECPSQNIKNLDHFLATLGVKGISEKTIEKLIDFGLVQRPGDFYTLTTERIEEVGITKRTALLIVARIWMMPNPEHATDYEVEAFLKLRTNKITTPMEKFFAAFGIKSAGNSTGEILSKKYNDWDTIKALTTEELEGIDGIGPITAKEIVNFFRKNKSMIEDVEQYFKFEAKKSGGIFENMTFVLSGSLNGGKDKWARIIEERGGCVKSSVSKKINYLVAGEGSGEKSEKAKTLNVQIITTEELEKMI